ncbi:hypothetical protein Hte_000059 [Hypoxylon texense]
MSPSEVQTPNNQAAQSSGTPPQTIHNTQPTALQAMDRFYGGSHFTMKIFVSKKHIVNTRDRSATSAARSTRVRRPPRRRSRRLLPGPVLLHYPVPTAL